MSTKHDLSNAIKRKIKPHSKYVMIGRNLAREIIKELEGKECQLEEKQETD